MKAGIDNAAHIGGLLSGFVLGIIYVVGYKFEKPDAQRTVSIIGELGIFCIFLFSFMILCKNVPPLYPEIRNEWESGIVEAYLNGELEEENENSNHSAVNATDNLSSRKFRHIRLSAMTIRGYLIMMQPPNSVASILPTG